MEDAPTAGGPRGRAGGFADWLPGVAELRRGTCDAFIDAFAAWGYGLVDTPLAEPLDTVAAGVGLEGQRRLFRFMDADGRLLAIVGERMRPIPSDRLKAELARLRSAVQSRAIETPDLAMRFQVTADACARWPEDIVVAALRGWARRENWWPTEAEV